MLPRNHPDRIQIYLRRAAWRPIPGCSFRPRLARHLGLPELVPAVASTWADSPGRAEHEAYKMMTLVASALAGGDSIDGRRCVAHRGDGLHAWAARSRRHPPWAPSCAASGGARPSTRPGEPRVAGPGLAGRGGTRRRAPDH